MENRLGVVVSALQRELEDLECRTKEARRAKGEAEVGLLKAEERAAFALQKQRSVEEQWREELASVDERFQIVVAELQRGVAERKRWADAECGVYEREVQVATMRAEVARRTVLLNEDAVNLSRFGAQPISSASTVELGARALECEINRLISSAATQLEEIRDQRQKAEDELIELNRCIVSKKKELSRSNAVFVQNSASESIPLQGAPVLHEEEEESSRKDNASFSCITAQTMSCSDEDKQGKRRDEGATVVPDPAVAFDSSAPQDVLMSLPALLQRESFPQLLKGEFHPAPDAVEVKTGPSEPVVSSSKLSYQEDQCYSRPTHSVLDEAVISVISCSSDAFTIVSTPLKKANTGL